MGGLEPPTSGSTIRRSGLTGGVGHHGSGDIFLAFTTANAQGAGAQPGTLGQADFIPDQDLNDFFHAVIEATEEAVLNSLIANEDMTGRDGNFAPALPKDWLEREYGGA